MSIFMYIYKYTSCGNYIYCKIIFHIKTFNAHIYLEMILNYFFYKIGRKTSIKLFKQYYSKCS